MKTVALIFGGRSAEHEISCVSARSVTEALDPDRFEVVLIGVDRAGRWHRLPAVPEGSGQRLPAVEEGAGEEVVLVPGTGQLVSAAGHSTAIDVVFPLIHGPFGEDGTLQGLLELAGVPYVGSGVLGSAVGMDKVTQKVLLSAAGLPVVPHLGLGERDWEDDPEGVAARVQDLGYPVFVKPANLGSSIGITKVAEQDRLDTALSEAFRYDEKALVERSIEGAREIECSVLGNDDPVASLPGEIVPSNDFYDYAAKYLDGASELRIPADLDDAAVEDIQRLSVAAFRALRASGMARVDFFLDGRRLFVNEVNTIPGFTSISMYPKLWEVSGLSYPDLLTRLIDLAEERFSRRRRKRIAPELGASPPGS